MKTYSLFSSAAILGLAVFISAGCGGGTKKKKNDSSSVSATEDAKFISLADATELDPNWSNENTLVYHTIGEPDDMHPTNGNAAQRSEINLYTQMFLVQSDFHILGLRPGVCKTMPVISEDGLNYTYELDEAPKWDDGQQLSAEDVIFTFKANKSPLTNNPHAKPYLENIKDITIDPSNRRIITLHMKRSYIQNIAFMTDYPLMQRTYFDPNNVLSKYTFAQLDDPNFRADKQADFKAWAERFNDAKYSRDVNFLVGMGPYKFLRWDSGQSIILQRKDNHWTANTSDPYKASHPEKIIFKINKDANSQMLEFKSQAMDASTFMSTKTLLDLQTDATFMKNYNSEFTDTYNYSYIALNTKPDGIQHKKFFNDVKVRRAIAMLVPVEDINLVVQKGKCKRMVGPVSPLKDSYNRDLKLIPNDLEAAKKLLDEAGWVDTDGDNIRDKVIDGKKVQFEVGLNYMTTTIDWKDIAQMTAESMYKAGIKVNLNALDFGIHYDLAKNHKFDMLLAAWAGSSIPEDFTQIWHTSSWASKGSNYPGFGNAESDALIDSIKYTIDDEKRIPMVKKLQELIYEEQPYVFLYSSIRRNVIHKRFGNQEMFFERPGVLLGNLKLLSGSAIAKASATP